MKSTIMRYSIRVATAIVLHFIIKLFDQMFHADVMNFDLRGLVFLVFCVSFVLAAWHLADVLYRHVRKLVYPERLFMKHLSVLLVVYLVYGIGVSIAFSSLYSLYDAVFFNIKHYAHVGQLVDFDANIGLYLGYCMVFAFNAQYYLLNHWKKVELHNQQLREENIRSRFEVLKNQVEPHFFFNSLSVLSELVYSDTNAAVRYIDQLSKLYRHILLQKNETLVPVAQELEILQSYLFLIGVRFGQSIRFTISIDQHTSNNGYIPHNSLQILAENVIKHNQLSYDHPLDVFLTHQGDCLVMKNSLRPRVNLEPGSGIGLDNIRHRYSLIGAPEPRVENNGKEFVVYLPVLKQPRDT